MVKSGSAHSSHVTAQRKTALRGRKDHSPAAYPTTLSSSYNMAGSGPETAPGLSVRCVSALDTTRDSDDNENDDVDDNALVLTCDQLQEVYNFCNQLQGKTDDDDRLQLYAEKCNELLRRDTRLQILIAIYNDVMSAVYRRYKNKKQEKTSTRT